MTALLGLFRRDFRLALRQGGDTALVLGFFILAVVLFPFGVGPEPEVLTRIAAGILWVAALLAALLSLDRLFQTDYEDGGLDLIVLSPVPLELAEPRLYLRFTQNTGDAVPDTVGAASVAVAVVPPSNSN